ncbi:hypothetical protein EIP86_009603 [Pleurotus ostreatoroseus]|nr:hypothetical protein EIP86_009603 [Pleurotus ostreatoroseus]
MAFFCDSVNQSTSDMDKRYRLLMATHYKESGFDDSVSRIHDPELVAYRDSDKFYILREATCPGARPSVTLRSVCDVMKEISEIGPNYHLMKQQCYWLCSIFIHLLKMRHRGLEVVKGTEDKRRGKVAVFRPMISIMDNEKVEKDIEAYVQARKADEEAARRERDSRVRKAYEDAVAERRKATLETTKRTKKLVATLIGPGTEKSRTVKKLVSRTMAEERERRRDAERQSRAKDFVERLAASGGSFRAKISPSIRLEPQETTVPRSF